MRTSKALHPGARIALIVASASQATAQTVHSTHQGVAASARVALSARAIAYSADEATTGPGGTDFNSDGDKLDSIACVVDVQTSAEGVLGVAVADLGWIGNELYLTVHEALDARDWNADGDSADVVLLHWSASAPAVTFVDSLAASASVPMLALGDLLFYASDSTPIGALACNLRVISAAQPFNPTSIPTDDPAGGLSPRLIGQAEGLVFASLNEAVEGRDLNGDGDLIDANVLALLDGTTVAGAVHDTHMALPSPTAPRRARRTGAHDWDVGFLVSESQQGFTNLNSPILFSAAWAASQCAGFPDVDVSDDVLHYLQFAAWVANQISNPVRNTGLAGSRKIAIANGFVATICPEASAGGCDLNQDGDLLDDVVRWTQIVPPGTPILPANAAANIRALFHAPGGTQGLAELTDHFVILVDESADGRDINGDGFMTFNLLGWLRPDVTSAAWDFTHGASRVFVGGSWMSEEPDRSRLDVALEERVGGISINTAGDSDLLDSVPTFSLFSSPSTLSFPGVAIAVDKDNAGIVLAQDVGCYRVSEPEDSRDWNSDGDASDMVLFRTSVTLGTSLSLGTLNGLARPSVEISAAAGARAFAFLSEEQVQGPSGTDFNGDGDPYDYVVRWSYFFEGQGFCFGDGGSGTPCPCINFGLPGNGCAHSQNPGGAHLSAFGRPSVTADGLVLAGTGMTPSSPVLYFQGTQQQNGGAGAVFGDGLRCAGGTLIRLGTHVNVGGASQYPAAGDALISVRGLIPTGGGVTRTYQAWYRDVQPYCTPSNFNLTNGALVAWMP